MKWRVCNGQWCYGDGVNKDLYTMRCHHGRWLVFLHGVQIGGFSSEEAAKQFVPMHYVVGGITFGG